MRTLIPPTALSLLLFSIAADANWSSCGNNLAAAQRYARDAEAISRELAKLERQVDSAKREYELCTGSPEVYDVLKDGCGTVQLAYVAKLGDFNGRRSRLDAAINGLLQRATIAVNECR